MHRSAGAILAVLGGLLFYIGFASWGRWVGLAMLYSGQQLLRGRRLFDSPLGIPAAKRLNLPDGFQPSFWNINIAIDAVAGMVWLRDGETAVLRKEEIVSVEAQSDSSNHQTNIGPRTVHLHCRLLVRTRNLAKPVWTIKFDSHLGRTMSGRKANYKEAHIWEGRMRAFLQQ